MHEMTSWIVGEYSSFRATRTTNYSGGDPADRRSCRRPNDKALRPPRPEGALGRHGEESVLRILIQAVEVLFGPFL
jgi:hypothetical protein